MDVNSLLEGLAAGTCNLSKIEGWIADHSENYIQPPRTDLIRYAEWVDKANALADSVHKWTLKCIRISKTNPNEALRVAEGIERLSPLLGPIQIRGTAKMMGIVLLRSGRVFDARKKMEDELAKGPLEPLLDSDLTFLCLRCAKEEGDHRLVARYAEALHVIGQQNGFSGFVAEALLSWGCSLAHERDISAVEKLSRALILRNELTPAEVQKYSCSNIDTYLLQLGRVAHGFGQYDKAISALTQLVEHRSINGNHQQLAYALSELGHVFLNLQPSRGRAYLKRAVELAGGPGATPEAARWAAQVEFPRGTEANIENYISGNDFPDIADEMTAYKASDAVTTLLRDRNWEKAKILAIGVANWAQHNKDSRLEAGTRMHLGVALASLGQPSDGIKEMRKATTIAARLRDPSLEIATNWNLARVLYDTGRTQESFDVALYGIAAAYDAASTAKSTEVARLVTAASLPLYEHLVLIASQVDHSDNHFAILRYTEQVRARNLQGWLMASAISSNSTLITQIDDRKIREALLSWRAVETELETRHIDCSLTATRNLELEETKTNARYVLNSHKYYSSLKRRRSSDDLHPNNTQELLHAVIRNNMALLTLFGVSEGVALVVYWRADGQLQSAGSLVRWSKKERNEALLEWADTSIHQEDDLVVRRAHRGAPRGRLSYRKLMARLNDHFFPALNNLVGRTKAVRLVVVPHRELALLPYWNLVDQCTTIKSLVLAPSVGSLLLCEQRTTQTSDSLMILEDPTSTLRFAKLEVEYLRSLPWRKGFVTVKRHDELLTNADSCGVLHFASHGLYNSSNPYYSGILAFPNETQTGVFARYVSLPNLEIADRPILDGIRLLTVAEIMAKLQLPNCSLAFLSSCDSGIASIDKGGELTGLPVALLVAGAKAVVASLWPVHDAACAVFAQLFYESLDPSGSVELSVGTALAEAREKLKQISRSDIVAKLGCAEISLPDGEYPFESGFYSDAFHCFGAG